MPSASIPKTRFLPAQNPPLLPLGPPQILSSLVSSAQLQLRNTIDSTLHITTRRASEESETPAEYHPIQL